MYPTKFIPFLRAFRKPVARGDYQRHRVHLSVTPRLLESLLPGVGGQGFVKFNILDPLLKICRQGSILVKTGGKKRAKYDLQEFVISRPIWYSGSYHTIQRDVPVYKTFGL